MIIRENINFERGVDPKKSLNIGTYVPGRLFKYKDNFGSRQNFPNVYILVDSKDKKFRTYFYIGRFIDPKHSFFGQEFSISGKMDSDNSWNVQPIGYDRFEPLSAEEERRFKKFISDPENAGFLKDIRRWSDVDPLLKESIGFQRGSSDREIKDILVGWREGQFLINPHTNIVYVYLKEWQGESNIEIFSIGHIRNMTKHRFNPQHRMVFQIYRKNDSEWKRTNFKPKKNLRSLNDQELEVVKPSLSPEYINKLESELKSSFGIKVLIP